VRVTLTVPEPVIVPWAAAELMTSVTPGVKVAPELIVNVPTTSKLLVEVALAEVSIVKL